MVATTVGLGGWDDRLGPGIFWKELMSEEVRNEHSKVRQARHWPSLSLSFPTRKMISERFIGHPQERVAYAGSKSELLSCSRDKASIPSAPSPLPPCTGTLGLSGTDPGCVELP